MSLGLVVFSSFIYSFIIIIIYDVILTTFIIILTTWLYNYCFTDQSAYIHTYRIFDNQTEKYMIWQQVPASITIYFTDKTIS